MVTTTHTHTTFSNRVYEFTRSVIRHRRLLITEKKSTVNLMKALRYIEELTRNNRKFPTDKAAGKFFNDNAEKIQFLIKHNDVDKFNTFNQLNMLSKSFKDL